ncbi:Phosphatidylglycerol--prolipoprotein diacylglyceryl transferase [Candidatus Xenohaliotis californiensis]|uniref:Phosphatidylglycerol--prolipoprotein diacylglyceryl transferase n=1 Tax=Candidatus Xenohaliotis californiensis TaxID=84677 RepID=A0ABM9N736_9RICK|nr:Phosphatidylglycerol--prolipoprotein diacylglyceryl transferase [Candidatus Xenohaliotis californiensis]
MISFPNIDPVAVSFGAIKIRWYSLSYIIGAIFIWIWLAIIGTKEKTLDKKCYDDLMFFTLLISIACGRIGYVLLYNPVYYFRNPIEIFQIWNGGMSFHGGLIGCVIGVLLVTKAHKKSFFYVADAISCIAPVGIFFGRIANFINAELYGRVTKMPWGFVFPGSDGAVRHPSQIYESFFEGLVLLCLMLFFRYFIKKKDFYRDGYAFVLFIVLYSFIRFMLEFFREPDAHIGYFFNYLTIGQLLSIIFLFASMLCIFFLNRHKANNMLVTDG